jgi:hypothetical protein
VLHALCARRPGLKASVRIRGAADHAGLSGG